MATSGTSLLYEFTVNSDDHCFNLTATDDDNLEGIEHHRILLKTVNNWDKVDLDTAVVSIVDNDGKAGYIGLCE